MPTRPPLLLPALASAAALALVSGCARISVPDPADLSVDAPKAAGLVTTVAQPLTLPTPEFPRGSVYVTTLNGTVSQLEPEERRWRVEAKARSEIAVAADGGLSWKVQSMEGEAWLNDTPQQLTEEQKKMLLRDYRLSREALSTPEEPVTPGESWDNTVPILRVRNDGTRTVGEEHEEVTFVGVRRDGARTVAALVIEVRSTTTTEDPRRRPLLKISTRVVRQLQFDVETGTVEVDAIRRHEVAASPGGRTRTVGSVRHERQL